MFSLFFFPIFEGLHLLEVKSDRTFCQHLRHRLSFTESVSSVGHRDVTNCPVPICPLSYLGAKLCSAFLVSRL